MIVEHMDIGPIISAGILLSATAGLALGVTIGVWLPVTDRLPALARQQAREICWAHIPAPEDPPGDLGRRVLQLPKRPELQAYLEAEAAVCVLRLAGAWRDRAQETGE